MTVKKILLLQLPLQGHDFFFSHENIPLASAGLALIAQKAGYKAELMPEPLMSYGNDRSILEFIIDFKPDVVGMSCYLWNIERSLFIAQEIKKVLPSCLLVLGGPEMTPENQFLMKHQDFDIGVVGEGEGTWESLLGSSFNSKTISGLLLPTQKKGWHFTGFSSSFIDLHQLPSPFLNGTLQGHLKEVLWVESIRGCVNRCAYCYYHKKFTGIRAFSLDRVLDEIRMARDRGMKEVVFLDPCWNRHPRRRDFLDRLLEINGDRTLKLYAECEVEEIDLKTAHRMAQSGFVELEVGLQSIKKETLHHIHRRFNSKRFLKSIQFLQSSGIEVMVDLIAGLPGEGLQDIVKSLHWVLDNEAYDSLMLYPLSLIPSTELYHLSEPFGLKAMPYPPYMVTQTSHLGAEEIRQAFIEYERCMGEDIAPLEMPVAFDDRVKDFSFLKGLTYLIRWTSLDEVKAFPSLEDRLAYSLTIQIGSEVINRSDLYGPILKNYLRRNPFSLLSIEVPEETSPHQLVPLWNLAREHSHPMERDYTVPHSPYRSILVLTKAKGTIWKWPDPREWEPLILFDGQKIPCQPICLLASPEGEIPREFRTWIGQRYVDPPGVRLWELPED